LIRRQNVADLDAAKARIDILAIGHAPILQVNRRMYRAFARKGWKIELAIPDRHPWTLEPARVEVRHPDDPPIHYLPVKGFYTRTWSFVGLTRLLAARRPRFVYLENEPDSVMAWTVGRWCVRNDAQLVVNTNENDVPPVFEALRKRGLKPALRSLRTRLWARATRPYIAHVVAICEDGRAAMRAIGFGDAVTVAPLGFDAALFFPDESRRIAVRRQLGLELPVIAYFGRLARNKGVHLLVSALGRLKHLRWQFLIDGLTAASDEYALQLRACISEMGIEERTTSITATHEEIPDFMRAADIVVLPSIWREQYGRVAPEAMACGCTVIAADIGALPELVGSAGLLVPPGDVGALTSTLEELLEAPEKCQQLAKAAVARARELLSIDRQIAVLDHLFRSLADTSRSGLPPL
jgi:glycosyltransferase involved in cell wall biosynthesis